MKNILTSIAITLLLALPSAAQQTSNNLPFTAVSPPNPPTLTSLTGLSSSGKIYTGVKMPIIGTGFISTCTVLVDGTAQPSSTFVYVSATEIDYTIPASMGSAAGTSHTIAVTCPAPILTMSANSPVTLPNGKHGTPYTADLVKLSNLTGGVPPYKFSLTSGSLPTGLSLSQSGIISGTPTVAVSSSFGVTISDSSGLALNLRISEAASPMETR
jgi:large repetitive protein